MTRADRDVRKARGGRQEGGGSVGERRERDVLF